MKTLLHQARRTRILAASAITVTSALFCTWTGTGAAAVPGAEPVVDLRVDANRDGQVDITGLSDLLEDSASAAQGALILPNIDDDARRCGFTRVEKTHRIKVTARQRQCNDAADKVVNGPADAHDLARIRVLPTAAPADASGVLRLSHPARARLFLRTGDSWVLVTRRTRISAAVLQAGLELGIEATAPIRDSAKWDGTVEVRLTVTSSAGRSSDSVTLRTAPLLGQHHLQDTERVLVTGSRGPVYDAFRRRLTEAAEKAGARSVDRLTDVGDPWTQDMIEPLYAAIPTPDGLAGIRVLLLTDQVRVGSDAAYELRGPDVGVLWQGPTRNWATRDSFGNLETVPPYSHPGRDYRAGRLIYGVDSHGNGPTDRTTELLSSQGVQDPITVDTSWLLVGHVDEFLSFVEADTDRGWKLVVADPSMGIDALADLKRDGHGAVIADSYHYLKGLSPKAKDKYRKLLPRKRTVAELLADRQLREDNRLAERRIDSVLRRLRTELGLTDDEIVRVPVLFHRVVMDDSDQAKPRSAAVKRVGRQSGTAPGGAQLVALYPDAVNGLSLPGRRMLVGRQYGPVVNGRDVFTDRVLAAYAEAGVRAMFIDDKTYHGGFGDVHCATNSLREMTAWW